MAFIKEIIVPSVVNDFVTRFISVLLQKNWGREPLEKIEDLLLEIHTVVEEAECREITNRHLLERLKKLMDSMYKGYYALDTFKLQRALKQKKKDCKVSSNSSFVLSSFNPGKRIRIAADAARSFIFGIERNHELNQLVTRLEGTSTYAEKFMTTLLLSCPTTLPRRPYDTYLYMKNCMVGRHVETEQIIKFLLKAEPPGAPKLGVLPIIGPLGVGKHTLVTHVRDDERVRKHFSQIVTISSSDCMSLNGGVPAKSYLATFTDIRMLIIIVHLCRSEYVEDIPELLCYLPKYVGSGSKVIVTGVCQEAANLGTVEPIWLQNLALEHRWYFFKADAFGSTDPAEYPRLASVGKEIVMELDGSFLGARIFAWLLRTNPSAQFWRTCLRAIRHQKQLGCYRFVHPLAQLLGVKLVEHADVYSPVEQTTITGLLNGSNIPQEQIFSVLFWKSTIPPYNQQFEFHCKKEEPRPIMRKRKSLEETSRHNKASTLTPILECVWLAPEFGRKYAPKFGRRLICSQEIHAQSESWVRPRFLAHFPHWALPSLGVDFQCLVLGTPKIGLGANPTHP